MVPKVGLLPNLRAFGTIRTSPRFVWIMARLGGSVDGVTMSSRRYMQHVCSATSSRSGSNTLPFARQSSPLRTWQDTKPCVTSLLGLLTGGLLHKPRWMTLLINVKSLQRNWCCKYIAFFSDYRSSHLCMHYVVTKLTLVILLQGELQEKQLLFVIACVCEQESQATNLQEEEGTQPAFD